jgi:hypothetical protein
VVELSETFDLLRVLATGSLAAAVVQTGRIILERVRGRNRIAEIEAERDAEIAKIEAAGKVEIAKARSSFS